MRKKCHSKAKRSQEGCACTFPPPHRQLCYGSVPWILLNQAWKTSDVRFGIFLVTTNCHAGQDSGRAQYPGAEREDGRSDHGSRLKRRIAGVIGATEHGPQPASQVTIERTASVIS